MRQVTVPPAGTVVVAGLKAKLAILTVVSDVMGEVVWVVSDGTAPLASRTMICPVISGWMRQA